MTATARREAARLAMRLGAEARRAIFEFVVFVVVVANETPEVGWEDGWWLLVMVAVSESASWSCRAQRSGEKAARRQDGRRGRRGVERDAARRRCRPDALDGRAALTASKLPATTKRHV